MKAGINTWRWSLLLALGLLLCGCANPLRQLPQRPDTALYYQVATATDDDLSGDALLRQMAPVFVVAAPDNPDNRIGTPVLERQSGGVLTARIDAKRATLYAERRRFSTASGHYLNLVYRIHFPRVPLRLWPFNLTQGDNGGLLVIVTLDDAQRPLLYTTVHSCGCYLAMIPTAQLPPGAYPPEWPRGRQAVYGENLPAQLGLPPPARDARAHFLLRPQTHRVMDAWLGPVAAGSTPMRLAPLAELSRLPVSGGQGSFFHRQGSDTDYVRNNAKPWEWLLMSWWALDARVGRDKRLGAAPGDGPVFYTSLKPWARQASDLRDFPTFLAYWGWRL